MLPLTVYQIYVSSRNNPMRGTIAFERLSCSEDLYLRILINDAVYRKTEENQTTRFHLLTEYSCIVMPIRTWQVVPSQRI